MGKHIFEKVAFYDIDNDAIVPSDLKFENGVCHRSPTRGLSELVAFPGFVDVGTGLGYPLFPDYEDTKSLSHAALCGGFQKLVVDTSLYDSTEKPSVGYLKDINRVAPNGIELKASTSIIHNGGLTSALELADAGCLYFKFDLDVLSNLDLFDIALLYCKTNSLLLVVNPNKEDDTKQINEGTISTSLGMKGNSSEEEELAIGAIINRASYLGCPVYIEKVSTEKGVELIKEARQKGINIKAGVDIMNLAFTDGEILEFDTDYKVWPPLRSEHDRLSLISAVNDGFLDCISSGHRPYNAEMKDKEFGYSAFGMATLESFWSLYCTFLQDDIDLLSFLRSTVRNPMMIMGLQYSGNENLCVATLGGDTQSKNFGTKAWNIGPDHWHARGRILLNKI